jgi:hypothetical protein
MKSILLLFFGITNLFAQSHDSDTTIVIKKNKFTIIRKEINPEKVQLIIKRNSKTITVENLDADGLAGLSYPDFNKDGDKDIMLTYMGNNFTYYLYLFDNKSNTFKKVEGFERFPEAIQLKSNPKFYYSYHRAGCADLNWISDLFYIDNFKSILIGHLYAQGCNFEVQENPQYIEVFKILNNKQENRKLIDKLPYLKNVPKFDYKWEFIKKYWNLNYAKFNKQKTTNR